MWLEVTIVLWSRGVRTHGYLRYELNRRFERARSYTNIFKVLNISRLPSLRQPKYFHGL